VKKRALNQNKNTNIMLTEMLEIVLTPKIFGPINIGGPRLKPCYPNGKPAPVDTLLNYYSMYCCDCRL